jgi:hypothetical protein
LKTDAVFAASGASVSALAAAFATVAGVAVPRKSVDAQKIETREKRWKTALYTSFACTAQRFDSNVR